VLSGLGVEVIVAEVQLDEPRVPRQVEGQQDGISDRQALVLEAGLLLVGKLSPHRNPSLSRALAYSDMSNLNRIHYRTLCNGVFEPEV